VPGRAPGGHKNCSPVRMEQMKSDGLVVVSIDYDAPEVPDSVKQTRPLLYHDGDAYCCVLGPDTQSGIFGAGFTVQEALANFDKHFQEVLQHPLPGNPVSDFIQHRHI